MPCPEVWVKVRPATYSNLMKPNPPNHLGFNLHKKSTKNHCCAELQKSLIYFAIWKI